MSAEIVTLVPAEVGEGYRFKTDDLLEAAKGQGFSKLVIIGELPGEPFWITGSANAGETIIMMELAKLQLLGK